MHVCVTSSIVTVTVLPLARNRGGRTSSGRSQSRSKQRLSIRSHHLIDLPRWHLSLALSQANHEAARRQNRHGVFATLVESCVPVVSRCIGYCSAIMTRRVYLRIHLQFLATVLFFAINNSILHMYEYHTSTLQRLILLASGSV